MGLQIRLDSKGIHLIKPGVFGSKDDFTEYSCQKSISSSTSLIGITTINFNGETIKGFSKSDAEEIEKIYALGMNDNYLELIELVGPDGEEINSSYECESAISRLKADYLQSQADKAAKAATEALNAQAAAASAAASAAQAYNRHQEAANNVIYSQATTAMKDATPPPVTDVKLYALISGQQQGPYTMNELQALVQQGVLSSTTMVWKDGLPSWIPASNLPELAFAFGSSSLPPTPPVPPIAPVQ